jgi:hypothetical protein
MSKNSNHYNWQNWIRQTKNNKKKPLNEMKGQWIDAIYSAIKTASEKKQPNFTRFFEDENRIVIPYDTTRMNKLAFLLGICVNFIKLDVARKRNAHVKALYKKYLNFDYSVVDEGLSIGNDSHEDRERLGQALPENLKDKVYFSIANPTVPHIEDLRLNIEVKKVDQKGRAAGGAEQVTQLTLFVPVIQYSSFEPWTEKTPQKVVDEKGKYRVTNVTATIGEILVKLGNQQLIKWWQDNQYKFAQDSTIVEGAKDFYDKGTESVRTLELEELIEKFNTINENSKSELSIIISRSPVDVLRMSDFLKTGLDSCHVYPGKTGSSYSGEYFYCALAEARNEGAIAYLVRTEDLEKVDLNQPEIFQDPDRNIQGIYPIERIRLRRLADQNAGVDFMIPEKRSYGKIKHASFYFTVKKWIVNQTAKFVLNDPEAENALEKFYVPDRDSIYLLGGSYSDDGLNNLGDSLQDILAQSVSLASTNPEEIKEVTTFIKQQKYGYSLSYAGQEDPQEAVDECDEANTVADEMVDQYDRYLHHGSVSLDVDCDNGISFFPTIKIETSLTQDDDMLEGKKLSYEKIGSFFQQNKDSFIDAVREEVVLTARITGPLLAASEIDVRVELFTGPQIVTIINFQDTFGNAGDVDYYFRNAVKRMNDYFDSSSINSIVLAQLEKFKLVQLPAISEPDAQDLIQKFSESLVQDRNHFKWNEAGHQENTRDSFILVQDPSRVEVGDNFPIVAKIPISNQARQADFNSAIRLLNSMSTSTISTEIEKKLNNLFVGLYPEKEQGKLPFEYSSQGTEVIDIIRSKNIPLSPQTTHGFTVRLTTSDTDKESVKNRNADFLNIRAIVSVAMDADMENLQEIVNAMNFIDVIGSQQNYQKVIDIISEEAKKQVVFRYNFHGDLAKAGSEEIADEPMYSNTNLGSSSLFTNEPMVKDQHMAENKTKKLVINERFKRLLRNKLR